MTNLNLPPENQRTPKTAQKTPESAKEPTVETSMQKVQRMQRELGNRNIQRVLAQRTEGQDGAFSVDDETQSKINSQRGSGQPLDVGVQQRMEEAIGQDFNGVRVHDFAEASGLSQTLQAKAFTTGSDIFFNQGAYQPQTSSGQELIAHELTHVVQQNSGQVPSSGSGMTVNAPNDAYEQQADATARQVINTPAAAAPPSTAQREAQPADSVQREDMPEEEEPVQAKALDSAIQREALPEEDETLQTKPLQAQELDEDEAPQA